MMMRKASKRISNLKVKTKAYICRLLGKEYTQIVICGIPRSGTSLLFNLTYKAVGDSFRLMLPAKKKSKEQSALASIYLTDNSISKMPKDVFRIEKIIQRNIANKKILFLVSIKDLRNVLCSKHQWGGGDYYIGYDVRYKINGKLDSEYNLEKYVDRLIELSTERYKKINIEIIRNEDLIKDPDMLVSIFDKYNIKNKGLGYHTDEDTVYEKGDKSSGEIIKTDEKWLHKSNYKRISQQLKQYPRLADDLISLNYENNTEWVNKYLSQNEN